MSSEIKRAPSPYFKEDGSYTRFGAQMEISRHVISVPNNYGLVEMAEAKGMNIVPRFPELPGGIAFLASPEVELHDEFAKHGNNSSAEYVIDWHRYKTGDGRENIIWFSRIPPLEGTSKPAHTHGVHPENGNGVIEHYLKVAGTAYIGEGDERREMSDYEAVPPHTPHYIEAGETSGAVFFILIENVEGIKDEDIHLYQTLE